MVSGIARSAHEAALTAKVFLIACEPTACASRNRYRPSEPRHLYGYGMAPTPDPVTVRLLGPPRIERDGLPVAVDTRKAIALLAYLAVTGRAQSRDHLAALLWPEADQARARSALRRTLSALNSALGGAGLDVARESLRFTGEGTWIDVAAFAEGLRTPGGDLRAAAELWGGDFLSGFVLRDSPDFDDWQMAAADDLRRDLGRSSSVWSRTRRSGRRHSDRLCEAMG